MKALVRLGFGVLLGVVGHWLAYDWTATLPVRDLSRYVTGGMLVGLEYAVLRADSSDVAVSEVVDLFAAFGAVGVGVFFARLTRGKSRGDRK